MGIDITDLTSKKGIVTIAAGVFLLVAGILACSATSSAFYGASYENSFGKMEGYLTLKQSCTQFGDEDAKCTAFEKDQSCGPENEFADTTACKFYNGAHANYALLATAGALLLVSAIIGIVSLMFFDHMRYAAVGLTVVSAVLLIAGVAVYKSNEADMVDILFGWASFEGFSSGVRSGYNCEITAIVFACIGEILLVVPQILF